MTTDTKLSLGTLADVYRARLTACDSPQEPHALAKRSNARAQRANKTLEQMDLESAVSAITSLVWTVLSQAGYTSKIDKSKQAKYQSNLREVFINSGVPEAILDSEAETVEDLGRIYAGAINQTWFGLKIYRFKD